MSLSSSREDIPYGFTRGVLPAHCNQFERCEPDRISRSTERFGDPLATGFVEGYDGMRE